MKRLLVRGSNVGCSGGFRASGKTLVPEVDFVAPSASGLAADCPEPSGLIDPQGKRRWKGEAKVLWVQGEGVTLGWSHPCHPRACPETMIPGKKYP